MGLHVAGLSHRYGSREALKNVTYSVSQGEVFGLLGPNGAGKSTTIRILLGKLKPTSGEVTVLGETPWKAPAPWRRQIGWLGEQSAHYERLPVWSNLRFWASLLEVSHEKAREALAQVGLSDRMNSLVRTLSRGMRQRLALARALLADPPLLLLDEPTNGLDVEASAQVRKLVADLAGQGRTIFLTTHDMLEAETLCHRVAVLRQGEIRGVGTPAELCRQVLGRDWTPPRERTSLEQAYAKLTSEGT